MTLEESFGRWMGVIDKRELESVLSKLGPEYKRKPICPAQNSVFKAFEVCPYDKLKVVMLGYKGLFFGKDTTAYKIGVRPLCKKDLTEFSNDDGITNSFLEILRHNSISDKENAFNKLRSLFICKMVDEKERLDDDEVDFQYKEGTDNYFTLYERLLRLFHRGMDKFLKEDVVYLEDDYISRTLDQ